MKETEKEKDRKTLKDKRRIKKKKDEYGRSLSGSEEEQLVRAKEINKCLRVNGAWVVNGMIQAH